VVVGSWRILLVHGHQVVPWGDEESLVAYLREYEADVIICGHTHEQKVKAVGKKYIINPGSATGAYTPLCKYFNELFKKYRNVVPSFIILEFKEHSLTAFMYSLIEDEVKIDKIVLPLQK